MPRLVDIKVKWLTEETLPTQRRMDGMVQKGENFFPEMILAERRPVLAENRIWAGAWSTWRSSDPRRGLRR